MALLAGCGDRRVGVMNGGAVVNQTPTSDPAVEIFLTKKPTKTYREIGWIRTETPITSQNLINELQKMAVSLGGDAIVINGSMVEIRSERWLIFFWINMHHTVTEAVVIKY